MPQRWLMLPCANEQLAQSQLDVKPRRGCLGFGQRRTAVQRLLQKVESLLVGVQLLRPLPSQLVIAQSQRPHLPHIRMVGNRPCRLGLQSG